MTALLATTHDRSRARILAIDPGSEQSAYVVLDHGAIERESCALEPNDVLVARIESGYFDSCEVAAIEMIASYGMKVGHHVFETCVWIGHFERALHRCDVWTERVFRRDVKLHLCGSPKAKDPNVRQALLDRFGSTREKAIGTKRAPGPLYGFKADMFAALAVAFTYTEGGA